MKRTTKKAVNPAILGLRCPKCKGPMKEVKDSRPIPFAVYRRRACSRCGRVETTHEKLARKKNHNR